MKRFTSYIILISLLYGCSSKQNEQGHISTSLNFSPKAKPTLELKIFRVEKEMFQNKSRINIAQVLNRYPYFSDKFLKRASYPNDTILVNGFYKLLNNKAIDTLYNSCEQLFGDFTETGLEFQSAFSNIRKSFPKFKYPLIYTIITGMGNDLFISDSIIVVGLEFFMGNTSKYKPDFPKYIQVRYTKEYLVPMCVAMISHKYNETDYLDNSLIAEMIYYGKSYYFTQSTLPSLPDTIAAGYSSEVLKDVEKNEAIIWTHFLEKKLLFETKHETVNRYVGERPATLEIGNKCPGRIGRWLGWQIVKKYMEQNPDVTLPQLMKQKDAKKILNLSKYRPKQSS